MVDSVATTALETLKNLLIGEANFLLSVGGQVEEVRRQLNTMHSFLKDVDKRKDSYSSEVVRNWVAELQKLSIQAEDTLEMYVIEETSRREGANLKNILKRFTCILGECLGMHQIGKEVEDIRSRMADLVKRSESLTGGELSSSSDYNKIQRSTKTYGHVVEEYFVGMKEDFEHLSSLVTSDERANRVISICGMGGLGKTTLSRKIYQSEVVQRVFKARAWICISQQFQPKVVFQELLKQLLEKKGQGKGKKGQEYEKLSEDELVRKLYEVQMEKKCLVVLDDIWEVEHWQDMSKAFPIVEGPCKVLLTSRSESIAATEYVHKLQCLSQDEGWELLQKIALPQDSTEGLRTTDSKSLEEIGREMVRKCGCLPLPISVIGGILRQKENLREWEKVLRNINPYLQHGKGVEGDRRVSQVLGLSYNALPYDLKPCFLYLGCFPEDEDIETELLYELWIAEGMISSEDKGRGEVLRDVAERYLWELANRCMVQVQMDKYSWYNTFKSCRLHDLMRELCLSKGKEENFMRVVDKEEGGQNVSSIEETPRLACYLDNVEVDIKRYPNLRSLLLLRKSNEYSPDRLLYIDFGKFKSLKILILQGFDFEKGKLPKGIEKLILLKLLWIQAWNGDPLLTSVFKLPSLQALHLTINQELPVFSQIRRPLRYLCLGFERNIVGGGKLKLDGFSELETLRWFDSRTDDVTDLLQLENLRVFDGEIYDNNSLSVIVDYMGHRLKQLREATLRIERECDIDSEEGFDLLNKTLMCKPLCVLWIRCRLGKLSIYEPRQCRNLLLLDLINCEIEEDPMEILGELPVLRALTLYGKAFVGEKMICRGAGFPQLRKLRILEVPNLVEWRVEEKAMPNLSDLYISRCKKLEMIPDGLKFITALKEIYIWGMPKQFRERVQVVAGKAGADWDKIKHVPSILIYKTGDDSTDTEV